MNVSEFLSTIGFGEIAKDAGIAILVIMTVLQIAPIKINPWGWIAKKLGRAINGEVIEKVDKLDSEVQAQRKDASEQAAINRRIRIVRFGDEIMHGVRHSKDHFGQTMQDIDGYIRYCEEHPEFSNSITEMTVEQIKDSYRKRFDKNDFY